jgi:uncharacterized protein YjiS (DUF1127 family)
LYRDVNAKKDTRNFLFEMLRLMLKRKNWVEVARFRHDLNEMLRRDEGVMIRSRLKQNQEEERGSLYHAAREMKNAKNNLNSIKKGNTIVNDREKI